MNEPPTHPDPGRGSDDEDDDGLHAPTDATPADRPPGPGTFGDLDAFVTGLLAPARTRSAAE